MQGHAILKMLLVILFERTFFCRKERVESGIGQMLEPSTELETLAGYEIVNFQHKLNRYGFLSKLLDNLSFSCGSH